MWFFNCSFCFFLKFSSRVGCLMCYLIPLMNCTKSMSLSFVSSGILYMRTLFYALSPLYSSFSVFCFLGFTSMVLKDLILG